MHEDMASKKLFLILTVTTVITVGAAWVYALPIQYPLYADGAYANQSIRMTPWQSQPTISIPPTSVYGFHATPKIPAFASPPPTASNRVADDRMSLAQLGIDASLDAEPSFEPEASEPGMLAEGGVDFVSVLNRADAFEVTVDPAYKVAHERVATYDSPEFVSLPEPAVGINEAVESDPSDKAAISVSPSEPIVELDYDLSFDDSGENLNESPTIEAEPVFESPASFASTGAGSFPIAPMQSLPAFPRTNDTWQSFPMQTPVHSFDKIAAPPQNNQWLPPANPTLGHNEMVPMNSDLSLSQPPQPGAAVKSYLPVQPPAFTTAEYIPSFNPQAGHRSPTPIQRAKIYSLDDGEKFDFETKKRDFPPFNEMIATGRFFYSAEILWAEPQFQGNTAIATEAVNFGESIPLDFDSDFHPKVRLGFESKYGPGMELTYFNINSNSEIASFTSDGNVTGHTNAWVIGRNVWSRILADDPGEVLSTQHSIDIDSGTVSFFKELKFPISRINGNFGFQYVSIAQRLNANVVSADGVTVESLQSVSDMRAFGPRAVLEYYRPIGHTPLELVTTFGGSVLFGQRDQVVTNSQSGLENRLGADEFVTILDFLVAVQYTKTVGENRSVFGRFGFMNQTWIGGGTPAFPQGDFGLRGLTFGIGYNR